MPYIVKYFEILVNSGLFLTPHKTAFGFHQSPIIFQKHLSNIETTKGRGKSHFHFHTKNTNQHEICYVDDLLFYDSENDILFCDSEVYSESGSSRKEYQLSICLEIVLYDGLFRQGKAHGGGKIKYPNGATYDGEFEHGKAHEGEHHNNKKHGKLQRLCGMLRIPLVFRKLLKVYVHFLKFDPKEAVSLYQSLLQRYGIFIRPSKPRQKNYTKVLEILIHLM